MSAREPRKKRLPRRTIGVPTGRVGATIKQAGTGLLRGSRQRGRKAIGVVPVGRKAISAGIRRTGSRSATANVVRRTEFAQRTGKIPQNLGSGEFKFPNLAGSRRGRGTRRDFDFGGRGVI